MSKILSDIRSYIRGLRNRKGTQYSYRSGWDLNSRETEYGQLSGALVAYTNSYGVVDAVGPNPGTPAQEKKMDERIAKKPVDVYKEIIAETPKMNIVNLDAQIKLVSRRMKMFQQLGSNHSDEIEALGFLKARKAGLKAKTKFLWAATTLPMIDALVKKYKVQMVDFSAYNKNVPMEAIDELEKFLVEYKKVRDDQPVLRLIIDVAPTDKDKPSREVKKDPILLASSPFGRFYYILGAWDKEVEVVDDLVYHGK